MIRLGRKKSSLRLLTMALQAGETRGNRVEDGQRVALGLPELSRMVGQEAGEFRVLNTNHLRKRMFVQLTEHLSYLAIRDFPKWNALAFQEPRNQRLDPAGCSCVASPAIDNVGRFVRSQQAFGDIHHDLRVLFAPAIKGPNAPIKERVMAFEDPISES